MLLSAPLCVVGMENSPNLYAARIGLDNGHADSIFTDLSYMVGDVTSDNKIGIPDVLETIRAITGRTGLKNKSECAADIDSNGKLNAADISYLKKMIVGSAAEEPYFRAENASYYSSASKGYTVVSPSSYGDFSIRVDFSDLDIKENFSCIVINSAYNNFSVTPVLKGREAGAAANTAQKVLYSGKSYYVLPGSDINVYEGIIITCNNNASVNISEIFVCENEYSAKWIIDNRILPPEQPAKDLTVNITSENVAIRLGQMTADDKTNTNGGMYHDYINTKWPTVTVDENDRIYISASGCRMAHVDPFGSTIMVTSDDGGSTFSKPKQISNTIMDDRDSGIVYLGNGTLLATYFTESADSYLPGGGNYGVLKLRDYGGSSASWQASSWDSEGNPIGGINGTYISMVKFILKNDTSYCPDNASYVIKSTDYGKTWNTVPYSYNKSGATSAMKNMLTNYQITKPGTRVPVTSEHGPVMLSDGTVLYAGKVLDAADQAVDTMAVYVSSDMGDTWEYRSEIERPYGYGPNNFHELSVTETADGALLCAIRTQPSEQGKMDLPLIGTVYTCFSYDGGRTWTIPEETGIEGTPPHVVTMPNGDIVMTSGHRADPRYIYANVSCDGGRTWSDSEFASSRCVNGDDMGYPASAVLSDGSIITVYYCSYHYGDYADQHSSIYAVKWKYKLK